MPEPQPFHDAGRDGDHVLHRTADLHADHVVASVQAEERAAELVLHEFGRLRIDRCREDRGRQLLRDLHRETRTGQHDHRMAGAHLFGDHLRHAKVAVGFEALGGADDRGVPAEVMRRLPKHRPAAVGRHGANHQPGAAKRPLEIVRDGDGGRQRNVGQVHDVGAARRDRVDDGLIARPQPDVVADPSQVHRQRRPPASRPEYRNHCHQARAPNRRSVPARSRARLPRCRKRMSTEAAHAAVSVVAE